MSGDEPFALPDVIASPLPEYRKNNMSITPDAASARLSLILDQLGTVLLGKPDALRLALTCLLARGHLLIEDMPGVGKTTLAHALAVSLGLQFQRGAGAAVPPVVPFQRHDAAAGAQVGGAPGPLWLRKPGQQQRV